MTAPLTNSQLDGTQWDVAVVGAGPAGSLAALHAARLGASVILIEKTSFPRYKVCGGCINGAALSALERAGLGGLPNALGAVPLRSFHLNTARRNLALPLPAGAAVSRALLDHALAQAAESVGAHSIAPYVASLGAKSDDGWQVQLSGDAASIAINARIVIAATGLASPFASELEGCAAQAQPGAYVGAGVLLESGPGHYEAGVVYMAVGDGGYVGLVRVEENRLNVAAAFAPDYLKTAGGLHQAANELLHHSGLPPVEPGHGEKWKGTPLLTRKAPKLSHHRMLLLGDCAGYVEPFTGEGMAYALEMGEAAGRLAAQSVDSFSPETQRLWSLQYARLLGRRAMLCRAVAYGLRRDWILQSALIALSAAPFLARPFLKTLNRPATENKVPA